MFDAVDLLTIIVHLPTGDVHSNYLPPLFSMTFPVTVFIPKSTTKFCFAGQ